MSDNYVRPEDTQLLMPEIDEEDVAQEQALLTLQGVKKPRKEFIRKRLQTAMENASLFYDVPHNVSILDGQEPVTSPETIKKILEWAIEQGDEAENIVVEFLLNPSERNLKICMKKLVNRDYLPEQEEVKKSRQPESSLSSVLLRNLKKFRKMSMDDLYQLAEKVHHSKRPRAAVRQTIRRWQEKGFVEKRDDVVYWNPGTHEELKNESSS